jgi:ABC-2 type transport system permease protein
MTDVTAPSIGLADAEGPEHWPPIWWILIRHEWRLTMRDFFNLASKKKKGASQVVSRPPRGRAARIALYLFAAIGLHVIGLVTLAFPRVWRDSAGERMAVLAVFAFLFTFMLSYTMSRIVAAFHERRDLDLLLSAPIDPAVVLAIRSLTIVSAATITFGFFVFPVVDVGLVTRHFWIARWYLLVPLLALTTTAIALVITDTVVRLIGVRRARVGLQVFSAIVGASMYFVTQARNFLPAEATRRMTAWIVGATRAERAPWPIEFLAAIARGDWTAWLAIVLGSFGLFAMAMVWSRRRFVEIAQTPDSAVRTVRPAQTVIDRRLATGFARGLFGTLLVKEWRLLLRAPQLISQILLQLLYLMPLMLVAFQHNSSPIAWGPAALAGGITGVASTLATSLAWLTIAAEDAPDLLAGSPRSRATILSAKLFAAALPPIVIVVAAAIGTAQRSLTEGAIVLVFGILACTSAAILSASSRLSAKRSDFQKRHKGRGVSAIIEGFQFLLWAGAAGTAASGYWIVSIALTLLACVMPAIRLPRALRELDDDA